MVKAGGDKPPFLGEVFSAPATIDVAGISIIPHPTHFVKRKVAQTFIKYFSQNCIFCLLQFEHTCDIIIVPQRERVNQKASKKNFKNFSKTP